MTITEIICRYCPGWFLDNVEAALSLMGSILLFMVVVGGIAFCLAVITYHLGAWLVHRKGINETRRDIREYYARVNDQQRPD